MDKLSVAITDFCIKNNKIDKEKREIYIYGFKLIFADIINFSIILLFGLITKQFLESILFLLTLCGLRQYSGGFHAKTFLICRLSMIATYIIVMAVVNLLINVNGYIYIVAFLNIISIIFVSFFAPVENKNKKLSLSQKRKNNIKSIIVATVLSLVAAGLIFFNARAEGVTISITLLAGVILMIIALAVKKGGDTDDKLVK